MRDPNIEPGPWCAVNERDMMPHVGTSRDEVILAAGTGRIVVYGGCRWARVDDPQDPWNLAAYDSRETLTLSLWPLRCDA